METQLEQIAVKAANQLPKSVVRYVGAGGGRPPPATRWAAGNSRPYRERRDNDTIHALLRPASKKHQSTKSREVGHRRCRGRYGDLAAVRDLSAG